jgi:hypothetical protein
MLAVGANRRDRRSNGARTTSAALRVTVTPMAGRDAPRGPDPDDWFAGADQAAPGRSGAPAAPPAEGESTVVGRDQPAATEDWLANGEPAAAGKAREGPSLYARRRAALVVGVVSVVLLLAGLAAGGFFSSGDNHRAATSSTAPRPTTARTLSTPSAPAALPAPTATLKPGDQGPQVRLLQRALASLSYAPGPVDGRYGPSTQQALTRFQRASSLTADGVLGPKTLAALMQALRAGG